MTAKLRYAGEIAFLNDVIADRSISYKQASYLLSPFEADVWELALEQKSNLVVDFRIKMPNGSLLTSPAHSQLLDVFKRWILVQGHLDATGGVLLSSKSLGARVRITLHLIDYFMLNAGVLGLLEHGLAVITAGDLRKLLHRIAIGGVSKTIYDWPRRAREYLLRNSASMNAEEIQKCLDAEPFLAEEIDPESQVLDLTRSEALRCRAWLWKQGVFSHRSVQGQSLRIGDMRKLNSQILGGTLLGSNARHFAPELAFGDLDVYAREYDMVSVRENVDDRMNEKEMQAYIRSLRRLGLIFEVNRSVPILSLKVLGDRGFLDSLDVKETGRFQTLPHRIVFKSLRDAIEHMLEHGDHLVNSYASVMAEIARSGRNLDDFGGSTEFQEAISTETRQMGVISWSINPSVRGASLIERLSKEEFFRRFRSNVGLYEALKVLAGCCAIIIETLMARRKDELRKLKPDNCLDKSRTRLVFENGKSGIGEFRQKEARPIPQIGVKAILLLKRIQDIAISCGAQKHYGPLLAHPSKNKGTSIEMHASMAGYASLNAFCDYFETERDEYGRRYYIRSHQLRRFFAQAFFWGGATGGMETLRWFLGHTNFQSLWRYITETTPGAVLRSIRGSYAAEMVIAQAPQTDNLSNFLKSKFQISNFRVLEFEELQGYIEDLIESGEVSVEPFFFSGPNGESFRIQINVKARQKND